MGKVLLIVTIVLTALAAALGFINKGTLGMVREQLASSEEQVKQKSAALEQTGKELKTTKDNLVTVTAEKDQLSSQADSLKADLEKSKTQVTDLTKQISDKESEISKLTADVQAKDAEIQTLSAGTTATASGPSAEDQAKMQEQETLIAKLQADLDSSRSQLEVLRKKEADRMALKMRNGLEGRILAVNQAWNFVVMNLGDRNGVVGNAEMLVKRGSQLIGKVRVTSVEPSTSIADIVSNSVPRGVTIQPGDNVIYQATAE